MTRIFIAILLITFPTLGNADNQCDYADYTSCISSGQEPNCYWDGNDSNGTCEQCPDSHPIHDDAEPYKGINNCYKNCPITPSCILPSIVPSNAPFDLKEEEKKAHYDNECYYSDVTCNDNYHANTTSGCCDPNVKTSTSIKPQNCATAVDIWQDNDYLTFCTECATDYHLENTNTATTTDGTNITYGTCVTNTLPCSEVIKDRCETNDTIDGTITGTITGNAQWNTDNGKYDYTNCTCVALTQQDELGNCGTVYNTWDGTQWTDSEYTCTKCIAGACWDGTPNNKCAMAQQGYYSPANDAKCHECPAGSTTPSNQVGADSLTDCILTPGTTKFCSNNGNTTTCFTLPDGAKTSPASKTPSTQQ